MRNPTLHLLGITTSPSVGDSSLGSSVFNTNRAEEELRHWLETRLDSLGIDPVAYSRFVLSLLRRSDSALTPPDEFVGKTSARRARARYQLTEQQEEREQKRAVVQCLTSAAENACGVESLVDELCQRLKNLAKIDEVKEPIVEIATNLETNLSPQDKAQRYFKAFPALQSTTPNKQNFTKFSDLDPKFQITETKYQITEPIKFETVGNKIENKFKRYTETEFKEIINDNSINNNNNNQHKDTPSKTNKTNKKSKSKRNNKLNNNNNNYSYRNNKTNKNNCMYNKANKTNSPNQGLKSSIKPTSEIITEIKSEPVSLMEKDGTFGFVKSIEMQREKEQELYRQRLAQLEAKFDRSLEALWNNGSGHSSDRDSIWAAPNLSMPESSAWPTDTSMSNNLSSNLNDSPNVGDDLIKTISPLYPWDMDWTTPEIAFETALAETNQYSVPWSNSVGDNPFCWQGIGQNFSELKSQSPRSNNNFFQAASCKNVIVNHSSTDSRQKKVNSLPEPEEDLLTSARTHFRPIKDDGNWADGTTFPINNHVERVAYRRSESGNLLYLPGGDSPYMEFRPQISSPPAITANLTPKFRVRQCDKCVQTEPIWSPTKRKITSEQDRRNCYNTQQVSEDDTWQPKIHESKLHLVKEDDFIIYNDRKRRHSSSFKPSTFRQLRPLTL